MLNDNLISYQFTRLYDKRSWRILYFFVRVNSLLTLHKAFEIRSYVHFSL
jgi:hypothetical protein